MKTKPDFGFSLIEVVLALGVISFAIVGIMGLFPVAMRAGLESQRETRAVYIARQIFADLQTGPATNTFLATGTANNRPVWTPINLAAPPQPPSTIYFDEEGRPIGTAATPDSQFLVNLIITTNTPVAGLAHVQIDVMAPATAPAANRSTNTFVTLMRQE